MVRSDPVLEPGKVYRTKDLRPWGKNPSRLVRRLEAEGKLRRLAYGLVYHPKKSRFGEVPPDDSELFRGFLAGGKFVFTGPERWNALGLGTTAVSATPLVYNTKRSGEFALGRRRFELRRVRFPEKPTPEWFVVDLVENRSRAGVSGQALESAISRALSEGRLHLGRLRDAAAQYATKVTQELVARASVAAQLH